MMGKPAIWNAAVVSACTALQGRLFQMGTHLTWNVFWYSRHVEGITQSLRWCWHLVRLFAAMMMGGSRMFTSPWKKILKNMVVSQKCSRVSSVSHSSLMSIAVMLVITWDGPGCRLLNPLDGLCVHFGVRWPGTGGILQWGLTSASYADFLTCGVAAWSVRLMSPDCNWPWSEPWRCGVSTRVWCW